MLGSGSVRVTQHLGEDVARRLTARLGEARETVSVQGLVALLSGDHRTAVGALQAALQTAPDGRVPLLAIER
jgi:arginase family enzyme